MLLMKLILYEKSQLFLIRQDVLRHSLSEAHDIYSQKLLLLKSHKKPDVCSHSWFDVEQRSV